MDRQKFESEILGTWNQPPDKEKKLRILAKLYHDTVDALDRIVCTCSSRDGKTLVPRPGTMERSFVNENTSHVFNLVLYKMCMWFGNRQDTPTEAELRNVIREYRP